MEKISKIVLSLGSNIGNREQNLLKATELIKQYICVGEILYSSIWETEPFGEKNQNYFLNMSISGLTNLNPNSLIFLCKSIEYFIGREFRGKWMEREIDIDILFFDDLIYNSRLLNIPHPAIRERRFVLVPTEEIAGEFIHPVYKINVKELLDKCETQSSILKYKDLRDIQFEL